MSETMTKEQILEVFKDEFHSIERRYERNIENYTLKAAQNYEYFFCRYSDRLYKATINLDAIKSMRPMLDWDNVDKVATWLENHINGIEMSLIEGQTMPSSASLMNNVADVLKRSALQELREDLQRLYYVLKNE